MKEKNKIFFGDHGITSTTANFIANIAKEEAAQAQARIENLSFLNESIELIGSGKTMVTRTGNTNLDFVNRDLQKIASLNSLIAWLREAIKAKEYELAVITGNGVDEWLTQNNIEQPQKPNGYIPVKMDDALATLTIKERNRYYSLEATCAAYGNAIHAKNPFDRARTLLQSKLRNDIEVRGQGQDTTVTTYSPSLGVNEVERVFFELQTTYRNAQKEFNSIKFNLEQWVIDTNRQLLEKFNHESELYFQAMEKINSQKLTWMNDQRDIISKLKIVIPNELQATFDNVSALVANK